ncbi:hypothetical protein BG004_001894, partial [Podila humilis]
MVLDINIPIPGGESGTLTSFSPHATVLPSNVSATGSPTNTPPKQHAAPQIPPALDQSGISDSKKTSKDEISRPASRTSSIRSKGSVQDLKNPRSSTSSAGRREGSMDVEDGNVTVDPITGMVTTTPGIKRMSTPPVNAAQGSAQASAAAAAAAANRERLEQRMRGIFKKNAESPPLTPSRAPGSPNIASGTTTNVSSSSASLQPEQVDDQSSEHKAIDTKQKKKKEDSEFKAELNESKDTLVDGKTPLEKSTEVQDTAAPTQIDPDIETEPNVEATQKAASTATTTAMLSEGDISSTTTTDSGTIAEEPHDHGDGDAAADTTADDPGEQKESQADLPVDVKPLAAPKDASETSSTSPSIDPETNALPKPENTTEEVQSYTPENKVTEEVVEVTAATDDIPAVEVTAGNVSHSDSESPLESKEEPAAEAVSTTTVTTTAAVTSNKRTTTSDAQLLQKIVEQREEQLFKVMQEHSQLLERFRDLEDAKTAQETVQTTKVTGLEKIIENQKKELELVRTNSQTNQPKSIQKTLEEQRGLLEEKDDQIRGLLAE